MRSTLLGVVMLLVAGLSLVCLAGDMPASDDTCRCGRSTTGAQEELEILLEQESGERMEWVCETYRYVICVDYDRALVKGSGLYFRIECSSATRFAITLIVEKWSPS